MARHFSLPLETDSWDPKAKERPMEHLTIRTAHSKGHLSTDGRSLRLLGWVFLSREPITTKESNFSKGEEPGDRQTELQPFHLGSWSNSQSRGEAIHPSRIKTKAKQHTLRSLLDEIDKHPWENVHLCEKPQRNSFRKGIRDIKRDTTHSISKRKITCDQIRYNDVGEHLWMSPEA